MSSSLVHHPKGFWFIFWGELAERASFYGMKTLLLLYMVNKIGYSDANSATVVSFFSASCYILPIAGGYVADHYFGKFRTIIYFAIPYIMGHIILGTFTTEVGLYVALALLAGGSGTIKPNISTLMGLMYQKEGKTHLMSQAFQWFYMAINIGAASTTFALPFIRDRWGYSVAFMAPTILMAVSLGIFYLGKKHYPKEEIKRIKEVKTPQQKHEQRTTLIRLSGLFLLIIFFWSIFDQSYSTWTLFARDYMILDINLSYSDVVVAAGAVLLGLWALLYAVRRRSSLRTIMSALCLLGTAAFALYLFYPHGPRTGWQFRIPPDAVQSANPVLIVVMTPLFAWMWSRTDRDETHKLSSPRKMLVGFALVLMCMGLMCVAGYVAMHGKISVLWEVWAYVLITAAELCISPVGLQLAFEEAPQHMKSMITGVWLFTVFVGDMLAGWFSRIYTDTTPGNYFGMMTVMIAIVSVVFYFVGRRFDHKPAAVNTAK